MPLKTVWVLLKLFNDVGSNTVRWGVDGQQLGVAKCQLLRTFRHWQQLGVAKCQLLRTFRHWQQLGVAKCQLLRTFRHWQQLGVAKCQLLRTFRHWQQLGVAKCQLLRTFRHCHGVSWLTENNTDSVRYNVTFRRVHKTIFAVEEQWTLHILSWCVCARACSIRYLAWKEHAPCYIVMSDLSGFTILSRIIS